jgi:hypothetical protein
MEAEQLFIKCSRFGGTRLSYACAHYDRYRGCRKGCKPLQTIINEVEGFKELVQAHYDAKDLVNPDRITIASDNCCSRLPVKKTEFTCEICGYTARSSRGFKSHRTKSHKFATTHS